MRPFFGYTDEGWALLVRGGFRRRPLSMGQEATIVIIANDQHNGTSGSTPYVIILCRGSYYSIARKS